MDTKQRDARELGIEGTSRQHVVPQARAPSATGPLTRAFDQAAAGALNGCLVCGAPYSGRAAIIVAGDEPVPTCPACDGPVDAHGRGVGLWREGYIILKVVRLAGEPPPEGL